MIPTQLTTLLQPTILMHAYYKQNTPLFLSWLGLYSTSTIYHFTKRYYPVETRYSSLICKLDFLFCGVVYIAAIYDIIYRKTIKRPYSDVCIVFHIFLPTMYIGSSKFNALMWHPEFHVADTWHAIFHILVYFINHFYLYNS